MRKLLMTIAAGGALALAGVALSQPAAANGLTQPVGLVQVGYYKHFRYGRHLSLRHHDVGRRHFKGRGIHRFGGYGRYHGLRGSRFGGYRSSRFGNSRFHGFRGGYGRFR